MFSGYFNSFFVFYNLYINFSETKSINLSQIHFVDSCLLAEKMI